MTSIRHVAREVVEHSEMRGLIEVYEEMAAEEMRKIREAILSSREYYRGLAKISEEVGADIAHLSEATLNRRALVLLSSDRGMYGEITDRVFQNFFNSVKNIDEKTDIYIAGRIGEEMMRTIAPRLNFVAIDFDDKSSDGCLAMLAAKLIHYKVIEIYFGQFGSLARQEPVSRSLSAAAVDNIKDKWAGEIELKLSYLYEPNVESISTLFGEQIFGGILEQTIKEDQLSKQASRLMHLDQAWSRVSKDLGKSTKRYMKIRKRITGKKQNSALVSYAVSRRGGGRI